jgi:hypothetical protein
MEVKRDIVVRFTVENDSDFKIDNNVFILKNNGTVVHGSGTYIYTGVRFCVKPEVNIAIYNGTKIVYYSSEDGFICVPEAERSVTGYVVKFLDVNDLEYTPHFIRSL